MKYFSKTVAPVEERDFGGLSEEGFKGTDHNCQVSPEGCHLSGTPEQRFDAPGQIWPAGNMGRLTLTLLEFSGSTTQSSG